MIFQAHSPLGIAAGIEYVETAFQLAAGQRLTSLSDGVIEARNSAGELFGFDRVHELLQTRLSATELANAAQSFGQEDDISVIYVTRMAAMSAERAAALA